MVPRKSTESGRNRSSHEIRLSWPGKHSVELAAVSAADLRAIEFIEPARLLESDGQGSLDWQPPPKESDWCNKLVVGDNLVAMHALRDRFAGTVELIYIDPPFATGLSYRSQLKVGKHGAPAVERHAYSDNRSGGMAGYLQQMYSRLTLMRELLKDSGKLFLHCDWRANSMLRLLLDEIFGPDCYRNEIIWRRAPNLGRQAASKQLGRVADSIYVYSKTPGATFAGSVPRRSAEVALDRKGKPKGARWDEDRQCYFTTAPRGDYTDKSIAKLREQGRVFESATGTVYIKYFLRKGDGGRWYKDQPVDVLWDDFAVRPLRHRPKSEDMGYDTQKPEGLLERIIAWSTQEGDLVADFYCGSGTTAAVAEAMHRRWLTVDIGMASATIARRRFMDLRKPADPKNPEAGELRPAGAFEVLSVERAERKAWCQSLGGDDAAVAHVLRCFGAKPEAEPWGRDEHGLVFVAPIDGPPDAAYIDSCCRQVAGLAQSRLRLLAWEWGADDSAALRREMHERHGVDLTMHSIPPALLHATSRRHQLKFRGRPEVNLELSPGDETEAFRVRLEGLHYPEPGDLPKGLREEDCEWDELIDGWMVDWRYDGQRGRPSWVSHRRRGDRELALTTNTQRFERGVSSTVWVKVITALGDEIVRTLVVA